MQKIAWLFLVIALLGIGFFAGRNWHADQRQESVNAGPASKTKVTIPAEYETLPPRISANEADDHRESHYQSMTRIDEALGLPSGFAQIEALSAIAGRSGVAELEDLILQAVQITDRYGRHQALEILFSKYTEIDAPAAVVFLRSINLDIEDRIINSMFSNWARFDLSGAIAGANQITNIALRRRAGQAVLRTAASFSSENLSALAAQLKDHHSVDLLESVAISQRASVDPASALLEAMGLTRARARHRAIYEIGRLWAQRDPIEAVEAADRLLNVDARNYYLRSVYLQWLNNDPDQAMANLLAIENQRIRKDLLGAVLTSYVRTDPARSLELADLLDGQARTQAKRDAILTWLEQDVDAALEAVARLDQRTLQDSAMDFIIVEQLAESHPDRALTWIETLESPRRDQMYSSVLGQIAISDPLHAMNIAMSAESSEQRERALSAAISSISRTDPQLALHYLGEVPEGERKDRLYARIATQWAGSDLEAAIGWASTLSGPAYAQAMTGLATEMAKTDLQRAAAIVHQLPPESRGRVLHSIGGSLGYEDPDNALIWLEQFRDDPGYDEAVMRSLSGVLTRNPQQAFEVVGQLRPEFREQAMLRAVSSWFHRNPHEAAGAVANSNAGIRAEAVGALVKTWGRADPLAVLDWAQKQRSNEVKDYALAGLVENSTFTTADVTRMINDIGSQELREKAISSVFVQLYQVRKDTQAAGDFLERVGASQDLKQRLLTSEGT